MPKHGYGVRGTSPQYFQRNISTCKRCGIRYHDQKQMRRHIMFHRPKAFIIHELLPDWEKKKISERVSKWNNEHKEYLKEYYSRPEVKERLKQHMKKYRESEKGKERSRAYFSRPEVIEKLKEYNSRPEVKARQKAYQSRPEVIEKNRKNSALNYWKRKFEKFKDVEDDFE